MVVLVSQAVTGDFTQEQPGKSHIENKSSSAAHTVDKKATKPKVCCQKIQFPVADVVGGSS